MKRLVLVVLVLSAIIGWVPGVARAATPTVRIEVLRPDGTPIACDSSVSGIGSVIINGCVTAPTGYNGRLEFRYKLPSTNIRPTDWYPNIRQQVPAGGEVRATQVVQVLSGEGTHTFLWKAIDLPSMVGVTCAITATNLPNPAENIKSERPAFTDPAQPADAVRISIRRYGDNTPVPCGSTMSAGRVIVKVEFFDAVAGLHGVHHHQEAGAPLAANGPVQGGGGPRWWEETRTGMIFVPANTWTVVSDTFTPTAPGLNTFHAGEESASGAGVEAFCSFTHVPG